MARLLATDLQRLPGVGCSDLLSRIVIWWCLLEEFLHHLRFLFFRHRRKANGAEVSCSVRVSAVLPRERHRRITSRHLSHNIRAKRPNDPIPQPRETRPAGGVDGNQSAMAGFLAAHSQAVLISSQFPKGGNPTIDPWIARPSTHASGRPVCLSRGMRSRTTPLTVM
jgi:hypothetical protein